MATNGTLTGSEQITGKITTGFVLKPATATRLGGIKVGSNLTIGIDGLLSLTKDNVKSALGYTPPAQDTNTTYSLSKDGSTVTLTGSDGSKTSVTDDNTTYEDATDTAHGLMTAAEHTKLAGIATGAQANVIETVKVNGAALTVTDKAVNIDMTTVYRYKGSVATYADLPTTGQAVGDTYNVQTADTTHGIKAGDNAAWNGTEWDVLGGDVDLSTYYTKTETDELLAKKINNSDYATDTEAISGSATDKVISPATLKAAVLSYDTEDYAGVLFDGAHSAGTRTGRAASWSFTPSTEAAAGTDDFRQYKPFNQQRFLVKADSNGVSQITDWEGTANFTTHLNSDSYGADCFVAFPLAYVRKIWNSDGTFELRVSEKYLPGYTIPPCFISGGKVLPFIGISCRAWQDDGNSGITTRIGHYLKYNTDESHFEALERAKGLLNLGQNEVNYLQILGSIKYANLNWQKAVDPGIDGYYYERASCCTVAQTNANSIIVDNDSAAYVTVGDYIGFTNPTLQPAGLPVTAIATYNSSSKKITVAGMSLTSAVGTTGFYSMCLSGGMTENVLGLDGYDSTKTTHKRSVKTLGIEDLYGNCCKILSGVCRIGTDMYINPTPDTSYTWPTSASNALSLGWTKLTGSIPSEAGYIGKFIYDDKFPLTNYPSTVDGDSSNPVGDYYYTNTSTAVCVALFGSDLNGSAGDGAFCVDVGGTVDGSSWYSGALGVFKNSL